MAGQMGSYHIEELINPSSNLLKSVIKIHRTEISQGFLSSLGDKALALLFLHASENRFGKLLIATDTTSGHVAGFLLGTIDTDAFYKQFLYNKFFQAIFVIAPKLMSLEKLRKVFETLFYPTKKELKILPKPELLDIAILKQYQGKGVAQLLFNEFTKKLNAAGIDEFKITTGENLVAAQKFYEKLGAEKADEIEVHKGQKTIVYIFKILKQ
jgi:ribosomal protein S18 acetylase RimI-like enzyme